MIFRKILRLPLSVRLKIVAFIGVVLVIFTAYCRPQPTSTPQRRALKPLYSDVNTACLDSVTVNLDEIISLNYSRANDIDITDWDDKKICSLTEEESLYERQRYANIFAAKLPEQPRQVTLVTHFSNERFDLFLRLVRHWQGYLSAAVQVVPEKVEEFLNEYCRHEELYNRRNLLITLVLQKGIFYPYNHLRNVALNEATTSHVFVSDSDLLPSQDLLEAAQKYIDSDILSGQKVLVVPSFEMLKEDVKFPPTKPELLQTWDANDLQPFYATRYAPAYMPINYTLWRDATEPYQVTYWTEFEPYVIAEKSQLQPYTERFVGRFYNKATHSAELFCRGFKFIVAPDIYNVHMWHESIHQKAFNAYFQCLWSLFTQYKNHLSLKYGLELPPKSPLKPNGKD